MSVSKKEYFYLEFLFVNQSMLECLMRRQEDLKTEVEK